jgi:hypothetical protein
MILKGIQDRVLNNYEAVKEMFDSLHDIFGGLVIEG